MQDRAPPASTTVATATATAETTSSNNNSSNEAATSRDYAIADDALRSLRNSRHSRRGVLPLRAGSNGSNKSGGAAPAPGSWPNSPVGSLMKNVRRIYGSTRSSVSSSITCTEFNDDEYSQDFLNFSDHSIDVNRVFAAEDAQPQIPQRHASVTAEQCSNLLSFSEHTCSSNLGKIDEQDDLGVGDMPPPLPPGNPCSFHSSSNTTSSTVATDLCPKQPGRKTSISSVALPLSPRQPGRKASIASIASASTSTSTSSSHPSTTVITTDSNNITGNNNFLGSTNSQDILPSHPSRKASM